MDGHPLRAQGQGGRLVRNGKDHGEIFDHHFVEYEYENGSRVLSQCRHMPDCMDRVSEAFHGTNGTAPRPGVILSKKGKTLFEYDDGALTRTPTRWSTTSCSRRWPQASTPTRTPSGAWWRQ